MRAWSDFWLDGNFIDHFGGEGSQPGAGTLGVEDARQLLRLSDGTSSLPPFAKMIGITDDSEEMKELHNIMQWVTTVVHPKAERVVSDAIGEPMKVVTGVGFWKPPPRCRRRRLPSPLLAGAGGRPAETGGSKNLHHPQISARRGEKSVSIGPALSRHFFHPFRPPGGT